ncbi:MAG: hypothetical protein JXB05_13705 [Myxococcaceae bacterium]|nr:hypothetical protein [Myxococcaceae bacterium]
MQSQRFSLGIAGLVAACLFSLSAHANSTGITQMSGKQGPTCMQAGCHGTNASALTSTVELTGPASLVAGSSGNYSLVIRGGPAVKAGMNVATDNGTLQAGGADQQLVQGELTHKAAKAFANNEARFDFSLVAPITPGTVTLYASGNSVNGDGKSDGDRAESKTLSITVTAAAPGNGGDEEDDGGCAAAGGAPMVLLLGLIAARLRRRD